MFAFVILQPNIHIFYTRIVCIVIIELKLQVFITLYCLSHIIGCIKLLLILRWNYSPSSIFIFTAHIIIGCPPMDYITLTILFWVVFELVSVNTLYLRRIKCIIKYGWLNCPCSCLFNTKMCSLILYSEGEYRRIVKQCVREYILIHISCIHTLLHLELILVREVEWYRHIWLPETSLHVEHGEGVLFGIICSTILHSIYCSFFIFKVDSSWNNSMISTNVKHKLSINEHPHIVISGEIELDWYIRCICLIFWVFSNYCSIISKLEL